MGSSSLIFESECHSTKIILAHIYTPSWYFKSKRGVNWTPLDRKFLSRESNICQEAQKSVKRDCCLKKNICQHLTEKNLSVLHINKPKNSVKPWQKISVKPWQKISNSVKSWQKISNSVKAWQKISVKSWHVRNFLLISIMIRGTFPWFC